MIRAAAVCAALIVATGCTGDDKNTRDATAGVLYTVGLSTDPYGQSEPRGFGVAHGLLADSVEKTEVRDRSLGGFGGAGWIDRGRIVVPRNAPPMRRPLIFRYRQGRLQRIGEASLPVGSLLAWSVDRSRAAWEPPKPCRPNQRSLYDCYRPSGEIFAGRSDGARGRKVGPGHLMGWTADGRVVFFRSYGRATPQALDLRTRKVGPVLSGWRGGLPIWSADGRYVAGTFNGMRILRPDGRMLRTIRPPIDISMFTWSPVGHRLAWTTSGTPDPHQLFVLDSPTAKPRLLYATGADHFDWVTWSPDGKWLLLDEEHHDRWLLLRVDRPGVRRILPRLGGRPLWCCPVNAWTR